MKYKVVTDGDDYGLVNYLVHASSKSEAIVKILTKIKRPNLAHIICVPYRNEINVIDVDQKCDG